MRSKSLTIAAVATVVIAVFLAESLAFSDTAAGQGEDGSDTTGSWTEFRGNSNNTGYSVSKVPSTNNTFLKFNTMWSVRSSATVSGDMLYFGSESGQVYALNISSGEEVWNYTTTSDIWATPLIIGNRTFVGSNDHIFYAFDRFSGEQAWTFQANGSIVSSAKSHDNVLVFGSYDGNVYFVNATIGLQTMPPFKTNGEIWDSPAIVEGTAIIGSNDGNVYRIHIGNGTKLWNFTLPPSSNGTVKFSSPAVYGNKVFIGSNDYNVYALDLATGNLKWRFQAANFVYASPAVHDDVLFVHAADGYLYALPVDDPNSDGTIDATEVIWRFLSNDGGGGEGGSSPAVADGKVLIGTRWGYVYCVHETTGLEIWNYEIPGGTFSSPTVADGRVYIGSADGHMYGFAELVPGLTVEIITDSIPPSRELESERIIEIVFNLTYKGGPVEGGFIIFEASAGVLSQAGASTLADGKQRVKYLSPKVDERTVVTITARATKYGMEDTVASIQITVVPATGYETGSGSAFSLEKYQVLIAAIIVLVVANLVIAAVLIIRRRRRPTE